jgi:type 1 glutamine amidotransferase
MAELLPENGNIQLALVTGGHTFQVPPLYEVFRQMPDADFYPQAIDEFTADAQVAAQYDVVLFYTMHQFVPGDELPWYQKKLFSTLEQLGRANQGIGILHHSLVAFPKWPLWSEIVGIGEREAITPHFAQSVTTRIVDRQHPITQGLDDWTMCDETYEMSEPRVEDGNHVLLTTGHPHSMKTLAWSRTFRQSRVFCYQSGHDASTFGDTNFRKVIHNAVRWLSQR